MKRLLLLLAVACVGLTSCSETLSAEDKKLEEIQKKFDFSEVDIENIQDIREETKFSTSDLTVFTGTIDDCAWIGVFDSQSGSLKCQYTDVDHPTSYFAYGEEYKYGVGEVLDAYFQNNKLLIVMRYADSGYRYSFRTDLVAITENGQNRHIIDKKFSLKTIERTKLNSNIICILLGESTYFPDGDTITVMYDLTKDSVICSIRNSRNNAFACFIYYKIMFDKEGLADHPYNIILSPSNPLHLWDIMISGRLVIAEWQCTYDTATATEQYKNIFDYDPSDCRYSIEYQTRTDDHISVVVTQTQYDGTVTTKTVDVRVVDDELKVEIQ